MENRKYPKDVSNTTIARHLFSKGHNNVMMLLHRNNDIRYHTLVDTSQLLKRLLWHLHELLHGHLTTTPWRTPIRPRQRGR